MGIFEEGIFSDKWGNGGSSIPAPSLTCDQQSTDKLPADKIADVDSHYFEGHLKQSAVYCCQYIIKTVAWLCKL